MVREHRLPSVHGTPGKVFDGMIPATKNMVLSIPCRNAMMSNISGVYFRRLE